MQPDAVTSNLRRFTLTMLPGKGGDPMLTDLPAGL